MKKIYMFVTICLMEMLLLGCGGGYTFPPRNHRADDEISRAIYEELGKEVLYQGRELGEDKSVRYKYYVEEQSGQLEQIRASVQGIIEQEGIDNKICIICYDEFLSSNYASVAVFYNFLDGSEDADLGGCRG